MWWNERHVPFRSTSSARVGHGDTYCYTGSYLHTYIYSYTHCYQFFDSYIIGQTYRNGYDDLGYCKFDCNFNCYICRYCYCYCYSDGGDGKHSHVYFAQHCDPNFNGYSGVYVCSHSFIYCYAPCFHHSYLWGAANVYNYCMPYHVYGRAYR